MPKTMPEPETFELAYRNAHYWVYETASPANPSGDRWLLRVEQHQPLLLRAYMRHGVHCASYLTACNPHGRLLDAAENSKRMLALREALRQQGWQWAEGFGQDPHGQWPGEDSVLVWGNGQAGGAGLGCAMAAEGRAVLRRRRRARASVAAPETSELIAS